MDEFRALLTSRLVGRGALARLEQVSGVKGSLIGRWRDGTVRPTPANLERVAPHLGVPYEDLLRMCGYLPGDAPAGEPPSDAIDAELKARYDRMTQLVRAGYPRAMLLAVLDANIRMAETGAGEPPARLAEPPVKRPAEPTVSAPRAPLTPAPEPPDGGLTRDKRPLLAAA